LGFSRECDLLDHRNLNLETKRATLASHTMQHELDLAATDMLGSIDAKTGELLLDWDADEFSTDVY
jgi:xylose isomerase